MIQSVSNQTQSLTSQQQSSNSNYMFVGPYRLEKTLGKGQTGLVKLGVHHKTGKKVAIKIVNREKLNESVLMKVEREITIMKLIEHNNVLRLYDVYDNKKYLYLVLEHVSGGELFDYLVKKSRLTIKESKKFFRQIISALDFCHSHLICHRDLKPENLLLDEKLNIKIADFGMASLQVDGSMLETSCGSPHYACPEVIRGEKYDGRKADVWSCGVILYALLVGALPFDDDNLKQLLEKIKKGNFTIPSYVPQECQELLRKMIEIDPNKRLSLEEVNKHPWVVAGSKEEIELGLPMNQIVQTAIIPSATSIDTDVLSNMTSLGCFKDQDKLVECLLNEKHNTEKVIYFLLLERKLKNPCDEDNDTDLGRSRTDAPRKRVDKFKVVNGHYAQLAVGSPVVGRRGFVVSHGPRHQSCHTTPLQSPCTSPIVTNKDLGGFLRGGDASMLQQHGNNTSSSNNNMNSSDYGDNISISSNNSNINQQIRSRINSFKITMFSTQKFYKPPDSKVTDSPNMNTPNTPNMDSKSWFQRWNFRQENINNPTEQDKEKEYTYLINDRPLNSVKADLIHAFLSTQDLIHNINNPSLFRCEYRSPDKFLARNVRFKVEILNENNCNASTNAAPSTGSGSSNANTTPTTTTSVLTNNNNVTNQLQTNPSYKILFTLISGSTRQFHQLCKHICMLIGNNTNYTNSHSHQSRQQQRLQQQQQQLTSPQPNNNYLHHYNSTATTTPVSYQNSSVPTTPILNSSIPVMSHHSHHHQQSPSILPQSRVLMNTPTTTGVNSSHYNSAISPAVTQSRRNSNNLTNGTTNTTTITTTTPTNKLVNQTIVNAPPHLANISSPVMNSSHYNGRKNSTGSVNGQFQPMTPPAHHHLLNNNNVLFNNNNSNQVQSTPPSYHLPTQLQQQQPQQQFNSNDSYAFNVNKQNLFQEIFNFTAATCNKD